MNALRHLHASHLVDLAELVRSRTGGRITALHLEGVVPVEARGEVAASLSALLTSREDGPEQLAQLLELLAAQKSEAAPDPRDLQLVYTGPELVSAQTLDTGLAVQRMFERAERRVDIASYVVSAGKQAKAIFGRLAERLDEEPGLDVRIYLNIERGEDQAQTPEGTLVRNFGERFADEVWPGRKRLPLVYHDPRSLALGSPKRACLHAKCIVVDDAEALVTSANFTEAAQQRNIELGVLVREPKQASVLRKQFDTLVQQGLLRRVPVKPPVAAAVQPPVPSLDELSPGQVPVYHLDALAAGGSREHHSVACIGAEDWHAGLVGVRLADGRMDRYARAGGVLLMEPVTDWSLDTRDKPVVVIESQGLVDRDRPQEIGIGRYRSQLMEGQEGEYVLVSLTPASRGQGHPTLKLRLVGDERGSFRPRLRLVRALQDTEDT